MYINVFGQPGPDVFLANDRQRDFGLQGGACVRRVRFDIGLSETRGYFLVTRYASFP